jgi:hypothetical protein
VRREITVLMALCLLLVGASSSVVADPDDNFQIIWSIQGWAVVSTNASTVVEETSATLNGFLFDDGGGLCQYAFDYDTISGAPYAWSTAWVGLISSHTAFSAGVGALTKGELYYFRAKAKNINGTSYGGELAFLTKPDEPNNFDANRNGTITQIDLTWNIGAGADKTVIVRKIGSYPVDRTDGIIVFNGTSNHYEDGAVVAGTHYYYRAWSYCSEGGYVRYSDNFDEDNCLALAPATFDIVNIVVSDNTVPHLEISVDVVNLGGILADITVTWTLIRTDTGAVLDTGADTIGVGPHTTQVYTIYPSTIYVGQVRITFTGDGATAFQIFITQSAPAGGGGGYAPSPPTPPTVPSVPSVVPSISIFAGIELPCVVFITLIVICFFILLLILWKRRKEERRGRKR